MSSIVKGARVNFFKIYFLIFIGLKITSAEAILLIPLPNLAIPPAYQKIIDELENSNETKAVALASEDKTFGSKQWVMGHHSGPISQEEANRVAMQKCEYSLAIQKQQTAAGKPLYEFGNKACYLYDFRNKAVSKNITSTPSTESYQQDSRIEKTKTEIDLPLGWTQNNLSEPLKNLGIELHASNKAIDAHLRYWTYPKVVLLSPSVYVKNTRDTMKNSLKDAQYTDIEELLINNNKAYRFEVTGGASNGSLLTFQVTMVEGTKSLVRLDVWMLKSRYPDYKDSLSNIAKGLKGEDFKAIEQEKIESSIKPPVNLSTSSSPQSDKPKLSSDTKKLALVIGNDRYKNVAKLSNAVEDAKTIAANLQQFGYLVTLKTDLNEKDMKSAIRIFKSQVNPGDEVAIFYAGHGVQLGTSNFLLPIDVGGDSEEQVKDESIPLQRILDDMNERKAKFTLALMDACRDNPFKTAGRSVGSTSRGLAPTSAATGQLIIFSAGNGQQALDKLNNGDKNKNGLFTRVFVKEMQKPNQTIDRVIKNVRNEVAELAKSVGHEQVPAIYDQVLGDFYFNK